jgi:hypothetical protein
MKRGQHPYARDEYHRRHLFSVDQFGLPFIPIYCTSDRDIYDMEMEDALGSEDRLMHAHEPNSAAFLYEIGARQGFTRNGKGRESNGRIQKSLNRESSPRQPKQCRHQTTEQHFMNHSHSIWSNLRGLLVTDPLIILSTILFGILGMLVSSLDSSGRKQAWLAKIWAKSLLAGSGLHVRVEGLEQIDPHASYVFAANHTSYMNTPVVLANLSSQFRFLVKSSLFKITLLGWHVDRTGHISVALVS